MLSILKAITETSARVMYLLAFAKKRNLNTVKGIGKQHRKQTFLLEISNHQIITVECDIM